MYKFIYSVIEIKKILAQYWVIGAILDIVIILLAGFLLIPFIGISIYWMFIPIFIYMVISLRNKFRKNTVVLIEEKYPELNERLRTMYDNKDNKNIILENLEESILTDIRKIKYSSFFDIKRIGTRIVIVLILVTLLISNWGINPMYLGQKTDQRKLISPLASDSVNRDKDRNIFDENSFISIANDSMGLVVNRGSGYELNTKGTDIKNPAVYHAFPGDEDTSSAPSGSYSETIPVIYQQIVKNYFMNISKE